MASSPWSPPPPLWQYAYSRENREWKTKKEHFYVIVCVLPILKERLVYVYSVVSTEQCCWSGMFIPGPRIQLFPSWIPDPNFFHPGPRIRFKEFKYFNPKKWFPSSRKYDPGCSSRIRILSFYPGNMIRVVHPDPDPDFLPIPDPGARIGVPGPGSGSATQQQCSPLVTTIFTH